jgi:hypothetical protein
LRVGGTKRDGGVAALQPRLYGMADFGSAKTMGNHSRKRRFAASGGT